MPDFWKNEKKAIEPKEDTMGLFSFGKKKQGEGFEFAINDTYAVKDSGSMGIST